MVPTKLVDLVSKQPGDTVRLDKKAVKDCLNELGVSPSSELAIFYLDYKVSTFCSNASDEELLDVVSPSGAISRASNFVHEVWELPENFICLSSVEAEGCYLYEKISGSVYDFDLADREDLIEGKLEPRWPSFFSFMIWYLS